MKVRDEDLVPTWVANPRVFELEPEHVQDRFREEVERRRAALDLRLRLFDAGSNLEELTVAELREEAEGMHLDLPGDYVRKDDLVEMIEEVMESLGDSYEEEE